MTNGRQKGDDWHSALALYYSAPRMVELRLVDVPVVTKSLGSEHVLVRTLWSGLSRGTEKLVFEGNIPESEFERMRAPFQEGNFPFPVKYGYSAVGIVEAGSSALLGKKVFALHPHQTVFALPAERIVALPDSIPARRAILAANMETALNAMWDARTGPGDSIVVVGAGAVGLLIASLAARLPGTEVTVCDINRGREVQARAIGAEFAAPQDVEDAGADVVFHASATPEGLATSLCAAGYEARVVELSWYGKKEVAAPLGAAFHSKRLRLISSQVGAVSDSRRSRWTHMRRLKKAITLLGEDNLDALITSEVDFGALPEAIPTLFADASSIMTAIRYS